MGYDTAMQPPGPILFTVLAQQTDAAEAGGEAAVDINTVLDTLSNVGLVAGGVALLVGLVIWLIGRKIARPACAVGGLAVGMTLGFAGAQQLLGGQSAILLGIGAAVIVGILAYILFRVWMGISLGLLLALLTPVAGLAYRGDAQPVAPTTHQELMIPDSLLAPNSSDPANAPAPAPGRADGDAASGGVSGAASGGTSGGSLGDRMRGVYQQQKDELLAWWASLGATGKALVAACSAGGAMVGLILGLLFPYLAATIQTAAVGGGLMLLGVWPLLPRFAPGWAEAFPPTTRLIVLALGLITLLGVVLQWTLFGRKSDD